MQNVVSITGAAAHEAAAAPTKPGPPPKGLDRHVHLASTAAIPGVLSLRAGGG